MDDTTVDWAPPGQSPPPAISYTNHILLPEALETWGSGSVRRLAAPATLQNHLRNQQPLFPAHGSHPLPRPTGALLERMSPDFEGGSAQGAQANLAGWAANHVKGGGAATCQLVRKPAGSPSFAGLLARAAHPTSPMGHAQALESPWPNPLFIRPARMRRSAPLAAVIWANCRRLEIVRRRPPASWSRWQFRARQGKQRLATPSIKDWGVVDPLLPVRCASVKRIQRIQAPAPGRPCTNRRALPLRLRKR